VHELFEVADVGLGVLDSDLRFVRVNRVLAGQTRLPPERHEGQTLDTVLPELAPVMERLARSVIDSGRASGPTELFGKTEVGAGAAHAWSVSLWPLFRWWTGRRRGVPDSSNAERRHRSGASAERGAVPCDLRGWPRRHLPHRRQGHRPLRELDELRPD